MFLFVTMKLFFLLQVLYLSSYLVAPTGIEIPVRISDVNSEEKSIEFVPVEVGSGSANTIAENSETDENNVLSLKLTVVTTPHSDAQTTSPVFVKLHGESGDCGKFSLKTNNDDLAQGAHTDYIFKCPDIGDVTSISIEHEGDDGWHPDYIEVENVDGGGLTKYCKFDVKFENTVLTRNCLNKVTYVELGESCDGEQNILCEVGAHLTCDDSNRCVCEDGYKIDDTTGNCRKVTMDEIKHLAENADITPENNWKKILMYVSKRFPFRNINLHNAHDDDADSCATVVRNEDTEKFYTLSGTLTGNVTEAVFAIKTDIEFKKHLQNFPGESICEEKIGSFLLMKHGNNNCGRCLPLDFNNDGWKFLHCKCTLTGIPRLATYIDLIISRHSETSGAIQICGINFFKMSG